MPYNSIANVRAQHGHGKPDEAVSGSLDDALANQACAILARPALGSVAALDNVCHTRRLALVSRHRLNKQTLRAAQTVIQRRVDRFVELGDGIRVTGLDVVFFNCPRATPGSRPLHVIAHQLDHIGMTHTLVCRKASRLRINIKTSVLNRLNKRITYLGQRNRPQCALLSTA